MRAFFLSIAVVLCCSCSDEAGQGPAAGQSYQGEQTHTLVVGQNDNAEVIKVLPGTQLAVLVASKARKITLLRVQDRQLVEVRSRTLFDDDPSESELTHIAAGPDGSWAAVTRTLIDKDAAGATTACHGELVFVDLTDGDAFGTVLSQVAVGPMPDAVDVSPDGRYVVSANERDVIWGKCEEVSPIDPPSVSIVDLADGPQNAKELKRVEMVGANEREPEHVVFAKDGDRFAVTLQDSHEVALLRVSELLAQDNPTDALAKIVSLPQNSLGQDAWPDGIGQFEDDAGTEHFAVAGEGNDMIYLLDLEGEIVASQEVTSADVPADFPRDGTWGPLFRPDSLDAFRFQQESYLTVTLKASGAVGVWQVGDPLAPRLVQVIKVGEREDSGADAESSVSPEGISASDQDGFIITANEGESSVSLIVVRE